MVALLNLFTALISLFGFCLSSWIAFQWLYNDQQSTRMYFQETKLEEGYSYDFIWSGRRGTYADVIQLLVDGNPDFTLAISRVIAQRYRSVYWECSPLSIKHVAKQPFQFVVLPAVALDGRQIDMEAFADHFSAFQTGTEKTTVVSFLNIAKDSIFVSPVRTITPAVPLRLQLLDELLTSFSETSVAVELKKTEKEIAFTDIASFLRTASPSAIQELWMKVGQELKQIINLHNTVIPPKSSFSEGGKKTNPESAERMKKPTLRGTVRKLARALRTLTNSIASTPNLIATKPIANQLFATLSDVWLSTNGVSTAWLHVRLDSRPKYYHYIPYRKPYQPPPDGT